MTSPCATRGDENDKNNKLLCTYLPFHVSGHEISRGASRPNARVLYSPKEAGGKVRRAPEKREAPRGTVPSFLIQKARPRDTRPEGPVREKLWFLAERLSTGQEPRASHVHNAFARNVRPEGQKSQTFRAPTCGAPNCSATKMSKRRQTHFFREKRVF